MKICGAGMARQGLYAVKNRKGLFNANMAISAFHDGLLAVCNGKITPQEAKEFFCFTDDSEYIGTVLSFKDEGNDTNRQNNNGPDVCDDTATHEPDRTGTE